ncbi:hypothetical protein GSI_09891 [Ganoderma sinense ZZ0214-1]|uniref:Uncharacterized protein n=1 Tax=Ganoderma sinense ZZ0214-1 TaxID=1077348 RepID=A0A2G8S2N9_9APHY|nr:hypothetical protein GSI_09891 [Ganoderma sinense ZZ0214-1]
MTMTTKLKRRISSYGDRPNEFEEVSEYFRAHFIQVHRRKDVSHRPLYLHFTSMLVRISLISSFTPLRGGRSQARRAPTFPAMPHADHVLASLSFSVSVIGAIALQDIKATQAIIINVGEAIMRSHLTKIGLA